MADYVFWDTESRNAGEEYNHDAKTHFRLGQYAINDGPVQLVTDIEELISVLRKADYIVGHNIILYDMAYLFGTDSLEALEMCLAGKVIDTYVLASLITPPPYSYVNKNGRTIFDAAKPERAMAYLALDNLAHQFGLPGKLGSLQELAKKYNPPKTLVRDLDYSLIPLDDPEFREYAEGDVIAVRALWYFLLARLKQQGYSGEYIWREMKIWGLNAQISRNGITVNTQEAQARVDELAAERDRIMAWLVDEFEMPTDSKQPWKSNAGKDAILKAFASFGITPDNSEAWVTTPTGAPSFAGDTMIAISEGTPAEELGRALATLQGQRSLAQLALESTHADGKIHPAITCLQRSGRTSVQRPGLTVWTARGPGAVEKRYFIADPGTKMLEVDYSAADARAVAAVSGDEEFAKRFAPGADPHEITGRIFFADLYDSDPTYYRNKTKPGTHGMSYRIGKKKLATTLDVTVEQAGDFLDQYKAAYPWVTRWQDEVTQEGEVYGYVTNAWGRRMMVDEGRSFTQSSALIGQSSTREILFDALLRIVADNIENVRWIRATVHDAVVFCLPSERAEELAEWLCAQMTTVFDPGAKTSQPIDFPVSRGPLSDDWFAAGHV